jgi:DNA-binding winged helix-turn-helix (wHTH) protein
MLDVTPGNALTFGEFALDPHQRRLTRAGQRVAIPDRHLEVLRVLLEHSGSVVSKDTLIAIAWQGLAVTDNSIEQAISSLRRTLGSDDHDPPLIQTVPRQGYRFTGEVTRAVVRATAGDIEALLAPHRAWLEGRAALETLSRDDVDRAERAFRSVLAAEPGGATAHIGLANALAFRFETSRADIRPHVGALVEAVTHAREACQLEQSLAEAWATLGFVLHRAGQVLEARAAVRRALTLEADNWRHHLRMAFVSWGEERLRAASRALQLLPGLALAHWLAASVHVARQAIAPAERELEAGAVAQDDQPAEGGRFPAVGLHWLRGLVKLRLGDHRAAHAAFERELAQERQHHLYTRECCANARYALGAMYVHGGDRAAADDAFEESLRLVPGYPMALAARALLHPGSIEQLADVSRRIEQIRGHGAQVEAALADSVLLVAGGQRAEAAQRTLTVLGAAPMGPAAWVLPVEPLLQVWEHPDDWLAVLSLLRSRAA